MRVQLNQESARPEKEKMKNIGIKGKTFFDNPTYLANPQVQIEKVQ